MGCNLGKVFEPKIGNQNVIFKRKKNENLKNYFRIIIIHPITNANVEFKYFDDQQKTESLMNIMNNICFSDNLMDKIDGNFISIYEEKDQRFHYYVQRLLGIEIEDSKNPPNGKMWVCYINERKEDWDLIVECNHQIYKEDKITWKYENF